MKLQNLKLLELQVFSETEEESTYLNGKLIITVRLVTIQENQLMILKIGHKMNNCQRIQIEMQ